MADRNVLSEDQAIELLAFLLTAARCLLDEPADYGSMRLLDAAERLCLFAGKEVSPDAQDLFVQIVEEIPKIQRYINQRERYAESMDSLCASMAHFLVDQSSIGECG